MPYYGYVSMSLMLKGMSRTMLRVVINRIKKLMDEGKIAKSEVLNKVLKDLNFTKEFIKEVSEKYEEYRKTISEEDAQKFYLIFNV